VRGDNRPAFRVHKVVPSSMQNATDTRQSLRREMRQRRAALDARERMRASQAVADRLLPMPELAAPRTVAVYWAVQSELPLLHAVTALQRAGHRLCLPVVQADNTLRFAPWQASTPMRPNRFGIPEPDVGADAWLAPDQLDVVLLPLLAFDDRGGRLGSGAGYYDRSFAFLRASARPARPFLLGVAYAFQQVPALSIAEWDVPLDAIVTEQRILRVG
jgi:5-formyltetrahydrofolate cyclo-ligase